MNEQRNDCTGGSQAGEASLRDQPQVDSSPSTAYTFSPSLHPSTRSKEQPPAQGLLLLQGHPPSSSFPSGPSAASSATPGLCRPAGTAFLSHPHPPQKANTATAREPQGPAMKNRCLPETCQPRLHGSLGSPPWGTAGLTLRFHSQGPAQAEQLPHALL